MGKLITLIGNTGVGKTSLARALARNGDFQLGLENHNDRPFQTLFKTDTRYALANQLDFFLLRAEQEQTMRKNPLPGLLDGGLDQDFKIFTRLFAAHKMLSDPEYGLCDRLYRFIRSQLPYPDLVIRLTATRSAIEKRLSTRDRINIATSADLDQIEVFLNEWITTLPLENVIQVDVTSAPIDYLEILPSLQMQIRERLGGEFEPYETGYIP